MNDWRTEARHGLIVVGVLIFALALGLAIQRFDTQMTQLPPQPPVNWLPPAIAPAPRERPFNPITTEIPPVALPYPAPNVAPLAPLTPVIGSPIVPANTTPDPAPRPRAPQ